MTGNLKKWGSWLVMTVGSIMVAAGVYFFKIPNGFITGGFSGVGTLLGTLLPILPAAIWIDLLNVAILIVGWLILGKESIIRTVYCCLLYSGLLTVFELLLPLSGPLTDDPLMELVYGMLLTSIGSGMLFNISASTGGTDIIAMIVQKYTNADSGKAVLLTNFVIAASAFFVYGTEIGLYSLLGLFAESYIIDNAIESINSCKYLTVITSQKDVITQYILAQAHRGVTVAEATGAYTGEKRWMLLTVCRRGQAVRLRRAIRVLDPQAFIIITTTSEIVGNGFRSV